MRRLRLNPIEEICFRVMMQLCGAHHQPHFAMEAMNEMNLMGMSPNAVTYGHYNKAVLESVWPEAKEASKALKSWQKLSLVLEVCRRFRICGREAQTVNSFSRERQLQQQQQLRNGTSKATSQSESDNVSRSSQESGLSRLSTEASKVPSKPHSTTSGSKPRDEADSGRVSSSETSEAVEGKSNHSEDVKSEKTLEATTSTEEMTVKDEDVATVANANTETPTTGTKNITRYSEIRGRFSNLLGPPTSVNRVLFTNSGGESSNDHSSSNPEVRNGVNGTDGVEPLKESDSLSEEVNALDLNEQRLPTVVENDVEKTLDLLDAEVPQNAELRKVASAASFKLTGVQVTENDPLGALSNPTSPSSTMPKSATTDFQQPNNHNAINNAKRPSLQENILGSPFGNLEMSKSSTLPLSNDAQNNKSYFSMASIKNMSKSGASKLSGLSSFKKGGSGYLASASSWMSPASKESMNKGISSLRSAYSRATTSISERVVEFREQTPSKIQGASSNPNLASTNKDEDSLSVNSSDGRRPSEAQLPPYDQADSWSNLTGQLWDQLMSYSYQPQSSQSSQVQPPLNTRTFAELFEDLYSSMPKDIPGAVAMELHMTSCSRCKNCSSLLYDEEIIGGWTAEDSNLNTKCPFCSQSMVPFLTVHVLDHRHGDTPKASEAIQVPYLSPLVLRKELESIIERDGDACLGAENCVDDHPIIYWNLVWYFERIGVNSHLPGLVLGSPSLNDNSPIDDPMWSQVDHRNVSINIKWDNELFNDDLGMPLYLQHRRKQANATSEIRIKSICDGVQNRDLFMPLKNLLDDRQEKEDQDTRSIYREMMFVTLESFGQDNIDIVAFDREYRRAFERLPNKYQSVVKPEDRPPTSLISLCRKFFRELKI